MWMHNTWRTWPSKETSLCGKSASLCRSSDLIIDFLFLSFFCHFVINILLIAFVWIQNVITYADVDIYGRYIIGTRRCCSILQTNLCCKVFAEANAVPGECQRLFLNLNKHKHVFIMGKWFKGEEVSGSSRLRSVNSFFFQTVAALRSV